MEYDTLVRTLVGVLNRSRVRYMFVGGIAANYWGFPRATFDVDVVLALQRKDIERLIAPLQKLQFDLDHELVAQILKVGNRFMARSPRIDYRIDFWVPRTGYEQQALKRRRRGQVYGKPSWLIAPEDLILMKLLAGRGKDLDDAVGVLARQDKALDWKYLTSWAAQLDLTKTLVRVRTRRV